MFYAILLMIPTCFMHTLCHIRAFSGTNLLTRCRSVSSCFLLFLVPEILHRKYSRNWTKQKPKALFSTDCSRTPKQRRRGATRWPPHLAARPRGVRAPLGCRPLGTPPTPPFRLYILPVAKTLNQPVIFHEKLRSRRHHEAKFGGTEVSVPVRRRDGEVPPEGSSIDTTAIFINAAVSHEEGVVLHRGSGLYR